MSVDILGTSCDQCRSIVQYSFTSTETRRLVRTDSPGRPPRLSHSSWTIKTDAYKPTYFHTYLSPYPFTYESTYIRIYLTDSFLTCWRSKLWFCLLEGEGGAQRGKRSTRLTEELLWRHGHPQHSSQYQYLWQGRRHVHNEDVKNSSSSVLLYVRRDHKDY